MIKSKKANQPAAKGKSSPQRKVPAVKSYLDQYAAGKALRSTCPRSAHAGWNAPTKRPDAVQLVLEAEKGRIPDLLPLRHGRMVRSAFTFYRGAALTMATDLSTTPSTGINVQCCGDAHLCNFGGFATPERRILFSINDLDETHPAPWEWDVKRLAASFVVACRDKSISDSNSKDVVLTCVRSYRESMREFSQMKTLELWYSAIWATDLVENMGSRFRKRVLTRIEKEQAKSAAEEIFPKLAENSGAMPLIKDQLPTIFHAEHAPPGVVDKPVLDAIASYRSTLNNSTQYLFDRYDLRDCAMKVVGVGSVGTFCSVLLFMARENDPLFLQVKEARTSVLEAFTSPSVFPNHGQRVVNGYRLMQPASDMFLGWSTGQKGHHFFVRQLRDIKISPRVETFGPSEMTLYAKWCGRALALSHARSGKSAMLSGYMGNNDALDQAMAKFAKDYADQNEQDHAALRRAIGSGKVTAVIEEAH